MFLTLKFLGKGKDIGLLVMRIGIGIAFIVHGSGKVFGGAEMWTQVGSAMQHLGISFGYPYWGFAASLAEFAGGILMVFGFLFRPATLALLFTMIVATLMHYRMGDDFSKYSHALELAFVFFGLSFVGPGRVSIDGE